MNRIVYLLMMTLVVIGCGGKETIASKSAGAFREAQKQGAPLGPAEHGHGAATPPDSSESADHEAMGHTTTAQTDHAAMGHRTNTQMDHALMGHGSPAGGAMRGADHSRMGHATAGTQTPSGAHGGHAITPQTAQMPTGAHDKHVTPPQTAPARTDAHAGHAMPAQQGATSPPVGSQLAQADPRQPAATLAPDSVDAPAPTSLVDSARSAEIAREMASGAHAMHGSTNYRQVDAGRVISRVPQNVPTGPTSPQEQHQHAPKEKP